LPSEQSPLQEKKREREQVKCSPLTSTTHSFALRAKPTPGEEERVSADQKLTPDLHDPTPRGEESEREQVKSSPLTSTVHSFALSAKPNARGEESERGQVKCSPMTSRIHSFSLRATPTVMQPRGRESSRADQELTHDLPYSQLCSQSKALGDAT
jgi:Tfp pilus assembly protein PilE